MLIKLLPEQINAYWPVLEEAIAPSINGSGSVSTLMQAAFGGQVTIWVGMENEVIIGVVTTYIMNTITGERQLIILSLQGFKKLDTETLRMAMGDLKRFARSNRCSKVVAYTDRKTLAKRFVEELGGKADVMLLEMEVS